MRHHLVDGRNLLLDGRRRTRTLDRLRSFVVDPLHDSTATFAAAKINTDNEVNCQGARPFRGTFLLKFLLLFVWC